VKKKQKKNSNGGWIFSLMIIISSFSDTILTSNI